MAVRKSRDAITKGSIHVPFALAAKSPSGIPMVKTSSRATKLSWAEIQSFARSSSPTL